MFHITLYIGAIRFVKAVTWLLVRWYPNHGGCFNYSLTAPYSKTFLSLGFAVTTCHSGIELVFFNNVGDSCIAVVSILNWVDEKHPVLVQWTD